MSPTATTAKAPTTLYQMKEISLVASTSPTTAIPASNPQKAPLAVALGTAIASTKTPSNDP